LKLREIEVAVSRYRGFQRGCPHVGCGGLLEPRIHKEWTDYQVDSFCPVALGHLAEIHFPKVMT